MVLKRSYAISAENGKVRVSFAKSLTAKTDWWDGAKNV
jgi:hypothetical protein